MNKNIGKIKDVLKEKIVYLPFIGWFITLVQNQDGGDFIVRHIKQSFILALGFTMFFITLGFMLTLMNYGLLKFIFTAVVYLAYLLYFVLSIIGTRFVLRGENFDFPFIGGYAARLNI